MLPFQLHSKDLRLFDSNASATVVPSSQHRRTGLSLQSDPGQARLACSRAPQHHTDSRPRASPPSNECARHRLPRAIRAAITPSRARAQLAAGAGEENLWPRLGWPRPKTACHSMAYGRTARSRRLGAAVQVSFARLGP